MKKTIPHTDYTIDHPSLYAIALNDWAFDSKRLAFAEGQRVELEFMPSMVVVHDPFQPSTSHATELGYILYSFPFPQSNLPGLSVVTAQQDGIVRKNLQFHIIDILEDKEGAQCTFCGKRWLYTHGSSWLGDSAIWDHHSEHLAKEGFLRNDA